MPKIYRTARGQTIDMESLQLANEKTIAVGNMKVNARGDKIGNGGKIVKTRAQVQAEFYQLRTPMASVDTIVAPVDDLTPKVMATKSAADAPIVESTPAPAPVAQTSKSKKTTVTND